MSEKKIDVRKFQRLYFSAEDHIAGIANVPEINLERIPITYLNLSEGGVCFQVQRSLCPKLAMEHLVILKKCGPDLLSVLDDVHVRVKHVLDYDIVDYVSFGCGYVSISRLALEAIRKIVAAGMKK